MVNRSGSSPNLRQPKAANSHLRPSPKILKQPCCSQSLSGSFPLIPHFFSSSLVYSELGAFGCPWQQLAAPTITARCLFLEWLYAIAYPIRMPMLQPFDTTTAESCKWYDEGRTHGVRNLATPVGFRNIRTMKMLLLIPMDIRAADELHNFPVESRENLSLTMWVCTLGTSLTTKKIKSLTCFNHPIYMRRIPLKRKDLGANGTDLYE